MSVGRIKLFLFLLSLALVVFLVDFSLRKREQYYREYLRYKEVMLLLKNYQTRQKVSVDENFARQKLFEVGADFLSFKQVDVGYELKAKGLRGENIPRLIYALESAGVEIVRFKAVDNTGQGLYELELILR